MRNYFFFLKKIVMPITIKATAATKTYGRALLRFACVLSGVVVGVVVGASVGLAVGVGVAVG